VKSSEFTWVFIKWLWVDTPHTINRWLESEVVLTFSGHFVWFQVFALIVALEIEKPVCLGDEVGRSSRLTKREGQPRRGTWGERGEGPGPVGGRMGVPRM
jgi:hypothetical protein